MSARAYLADPDAIRRASFEIVRQEARLERFPTALRPLAARLVHSCGMPDIADDLAWGGDVVEAGRAALRAGRPVLVDARMVAAGIARDGVPAPPILCRLDDPRVPALATTLGTTRSAAAVELWRGDLEGAVVAIGNAPTALFHLLDRLREWPERPALILAVPVGFVGAAESKAALAASGLDVPWLTLHGRRGGSAMAAAAVNALLREEP